MKISLLLLSVFFFLPYFTVGQGLLPYHSVRFVEDGQELAYPFSGGFNQPQFSVIDWDQDLQPDLFVFDRSGNYPLSFLAEANDGLVQYQYVPAYQQALPPLENWALMADMNCDGKADLFTSNGAESGIRVYQNLSHNGEPLFHLAADLLFTTDSLKLFVGTADIPALVDVDDDGDLDILAFDASGLFVRWYERLGNGNCQTLEFVLGDPCWGNFMEAGLNNDIILHTTCKGGSNNSGGKHAGSTVCALDLNGDGAKELILGDISHENLVLLSNGGTPTAADMMAVDISFPSNDLPANIFIFPAAFSVDVDQDGRTDIVAAPNASGTSANFHNLWYYRDVGTGTNSVFELQTQRFLESATVDCGESSAPVFFDYNQDGKLDIVVGNYLYRESPQSDQVGLTLYENIGTPTLPRYELITRDYLQLSTLFNPPIFGAHPAFGDLDQDGDPDLILGDLNGKIHFFRNDAPTGQTADFVLAGPEYKGIDVGQQASPQLVDVNRDGKLDLLIGEQAGNLNYYENIGSPTVANFGSGNNFFGQIDLQPACCTGFSVPFLYENEQGNWELLVGGETGEVFQYDSIDGNLTGAFSLKTNRFGEIQEGSRLSISGADIDQDGKMEWIAGNRRGGIALFDHQGMTALEPFVDPRIRFDIFPNPGTQSQAKIHLPAKPTGSLALHIVQPNGQLVAQISLPADKTDFQFALPPLPAGIYFLQIVGEKQLSSTRKWLVF